RNIRAHFSPPLVALFGGSIVFACFATDVAELLGAAIGFRILFHIPMVIGAPLTVIIETVAILSQRYHRLERMIALFLVVIGVCYVAEIFLVNPAWGELFPHIFVPMVNSGNILIIVGILGAIVMPHNIYLHSNVIQSRDWGKNEGERRSLLRMELADTSLAMFAGWLINSAMIIVAAAVFYRHGVIVNSIEQAAATMGPLAGRLAGGLFGIALLFAGISSSITSSLAETNVITGFLGRPEDPRTWLYRIALVVTSIPAMVVILMQTDSYRVLILSQVALSIQLPLTIFPLLFLVNSRKVMGNFASRPVEFAIGLILSAVVTVLNGLLLYQTFGGRFG
ncbi:MAG TPA: hypothetical protein ENH11_09385, partial [Candidatus Acetothermia bacterium]|nr:hypothetical protein [Candidatus Acetothermia bacterium]